jgi:hypothetical protein
MPSTLTDSLRIREPDLGDHAGLLKIIVEERVNSPTRFEFLFAGDGRQLANRHALRAGQPIVIQLGERELRGHIWGHRTESRVISGNVIGAGQTGLQTRVWGFDSLQQLRMGRRSRAFVRRSVEDVAKHICSRTSFSVEYAGIDSAFSRGDGPIVQYLESDFDFLARLAERVGGDLWSWHNKLWIGHGPGASEPVVSLDLDQETEWLIGEDWSHEVEGWFIRTTGAPVDGVAPAEMDDESVIETGGSDDSDGEANSASDALLRGATVAPTPGVMASAAESKALAQFLRQRQRRHRVMGALHINELAPQNLHLGTRVQLMQGETELAETVAVGITSQWQATGNSLGTRGSCDCVIAFGKPSPQATPELDAFPAKHLWPALVDGHPGIEHGTIGVRPLGWDPSSDPLPARVVVGTAGETAVFSHPHPGELGIIGFESGDPGAPVWLGSLHQRQVPDGAIDPLVWAWRLPGGSGSVRIREGTVAIDLKGLGLSVQTDGKVSLEGSELKLESVEAVKLKGKELRLQGEKSFNMKGKTIEIAASKVDVKKE